MSNHKSKQTVNQETYVSIKDYCFKYPSNENDLFWSKHNMFDSKQKFVSRVDNPSKLVQLRLYGMLLNESKKY